MNKYDKYIQLLKANKNLIFTGAPGTGKTHLAKEIAGEMVEKTFRPLDRITDKEIADYLKPRLEIESVSKNVQYQIDRLASREVHLSGKTIQNKRISFEDIIDAYHNKLWEMGKARSLSTAKIALAHYIYRERSKRLKTQIEVVQFHPSYDYTDFVEGLRPVKHSDKDTICFERRDGIFKSFCKEALENNLPEEPIGFNLYGEAYNEKIRTFFDTSIREKRIFYGKNKSENRTEFYIKEYTNEIIIVHNLNLKKDFELEYMVFYNFLKHDVSLKSVEDVDMYRQTFVPYARNGNFGTQLRTYVYSIYMELKKYVYPDGIVDPMIYSKSSTPPNYIFIIDEINRGEVSKIFGELFSCIDPEYRGERGKVTTQYANLIEDDDVFKEGFYVPENVYIIATMNDIDRSVESMDFAFRRRFAWKEIEVEDTLEDIVASIKASPEWREEAVRRLTNLNDAITKDERLGKAYNIGGSYLLKLNSIKEYKPKAAFEQLWNYHIENVLREYLRGLPISEISRKVEDFKQAYQ